LQKNCNFYFVKLYSGSVAVITVFCAKFGIVFSGFIAAIVKSSSFLKNFAKFNSGNVRVGYYHRSKSLGSGLAGFKASKTRLEKAFVLIEVLALTFSTYSYTSKLGEKNVSCLGSIFALLYCTLLVRY